MNRFRTKKKAKDDSSAPRPSVEHESSGPFRMFGKKKVQEEEPKKDIDLATALPSSDDFRTSLLMNGLSARFSMLREQDDPNSKIGKASDDSVLFPKRQSRLDMFGAGLHDIAEVESLRAPPFARQDSLVSDDAASTSGSVMNRSKPTEGNNLFGGRQKIYMIPAGGNKSNGLPGRALYEDDVALSAFQRWRQAEKERSSMEEIQSTQTYEQDLVRAESPPHNDFSRRRETNSTTSSGPSLARNSTAATSVSSNHPLSSVKDSQANGTLPMSYTTSNIPERSVTRTRRLYEQGLTQELQDSQTSALSRFDTISKQRAIGIRSPDNTPSPTTGVFPDRRPGILSKASAPNLRSFTPPTTTSAQMSPAESSSKFSTSEQKLNFGASPPLSPPVSESDEQPTLPIQPNDMGKATAMGVFSRPLQQYDESRYAQRQRQLQQGRETPTSRFRADSNASAPTSRSRSSSSLRRQPAEKMEPGIGQIEPTVQEEPPRTTFLDDSDAEPSPTVAAHVPQNHAAAAPLLTLERPKDEDIHPALRQSALPTPLSISSDTPSPISDQPTKSLATSRDISPEDSPTLGPQTGLSGMVRQHLRSASTASSIYGPDDQDPETRYSNYPSSGRALDSMVSTGNPWSYADLERYDNDNLGANPLLSPSLSQAPQKAPPPIPQTTPTVDIASPQSPVDSAENDFARHLQDGARRVRERLTSYIETDNGNNLGTSLADSVADLQPPQRPSTRGSLKSKSSLGSIRTKEPRDHSQSRARKMLGLGASTMASAPSPTRSTSAEDDLAGSKQADSSRKTSPDEPRSSSDKDEKEDKEEHVHAGLKAFRQARRELQRMKELETRQRRQPAAGSPVSSQSAAPSDRERGPTFRASSQERGQPPVSYSARKYSEEQYQPGGSRAASRASTERDRSGSEASNGRSHSRPPYLRNTSRPSSPGLGPVTSGNTRHGAASRSAFPPQGGSQGLSVQTRSYDTAERSPGLPASPRPGDFGPLPGSFPRRPAAQGTASDSLIETLGSQGPSVESQSYPMTRPRNGSQLNTTASTPNLRAAGSAAPPLPPINPRRKNTGAFRRYDQEELTASSPHLPLSPGKGAAGRMNAHDDAYTRKISLESNGFGTRGRPMQHSPPRSGRMPPQQPMSDIQGGMF
ncbi:hypothetical protein NLU13_9517 [Sarocladium strictum]|uniref:Uncharacterized protein n=1 Tax=Sarocladium strictum TaxID=5046 RepID=A0AA39GAR3_SARSR|nr:hypothetical protein NLU13_9517 [Sarocladium strictum]